MPLFENTDQLKKEKPTDPNNNQKQSGIITTLGSLLPFAPLLFEQFTGQKIPQMSGTMAEIQTALGQIANNQQVIITNQQSLNQRLNQLESTADHKLTYLTHQFKNLRLTHTKEQKQIEYSDPQSEEN